MPLPSERNGSIFVIAHGEEGSESGGDGRKYPAEHRTDGQPKGHGEDGLGVLPTDLVDAEIPQVK